MSTTEYRNQTEPGVAGDVFRSLIFYETSRFQKELSTGKYFFEGMEERAFVVSLADAADELFDGYSGTYRAEEVFKGTCGREMI